MVRVAPQLEPDRRADLRGGLAAGSRPARNSATTRASRAELEPSGSPNSISSSSVRSIHAGLGPTAGAPRVGHRADRPWADGRRAASIAPVRESIAARARAVERPRPPCGKYHHGTPFWTGTINGCRGLKQAAPRSAPGRWPTSRPLTARITIVTAARARAGAAAGARTGTVARLARPTISVMPAAAGIGVRAWAPARQHRHVPRRCARRTGAPIGPPDRARPPTMQILIGFALVKPNPHPAILPRERPRRTRMEREPCQRACAGMLGDRARSSGCAFVGSRRPNRNLRPFRLEPR